MLLQDTLNSSSVFRVTEVLEDRLDTLQFKKGQSVYCQNSTPLGAYFIKHGRVKITRMGSDGKEKILRIATANEMLSYADILDNTHYSNAACAMEDTVIYFVPKQDFLTTIKEHPLLHEQFLVQLSNDLLQTQAVITNMAYKPVRGRLADALLELTNNIKDVNSQLPCVNISRADLASYVGTAKETINRLISEFRNDKLITTDGHNICIINWDGLHMVCNMYN